MRLIRKLMIMLAVAASVFVLMPAAAAQADPRWVTVCWPIHEPPWVKCVEFPVLIIAEDPEWPPDICPVCDLALDLLDDKIYPPIDEQFLDLFTQGFGLLAKSTLVEDPKEALELRGQSADVLLKSAAVLNEYDVQLELDRVGGYLQEKNEFVEVDNDHLVSMGKNLVEGERLMQQAELGKDPDAVVEEAMAHFDQAYADLSALYGG
ncbi:hypothetical protein [Glycomyces arizonensis]|uniref:hypothetical protein n=1 Tax=Glycomyces arizonensis TaxID=256035 RepID=UPI00040DC1C9|nr:hypothetical protein [Glycomyces arizonensis]